MQKIQKKLIGFSICGALLLLAIVLSFQVVGAQSGLKVQYRCADTNASGNQIKPHLNIVNTGSGAVSLNALKARYYYTIDGEKAQNYWCDYAAIGCSNVTGTFVKMSAAVSGADYYLEVGFTSGTLNAGASTGEIQNRFAKSDWTNYTQTGDYSFDPGKTGFADWDRVTLYNNGVLVWGIEPGGSAAPTNTSAAAASATRTSTPGGPTSTRTSTPTATRTPTRTATAAAGVTATATLPPAATATRTNTAVPTTPPSGSARQVEKLNRGLVRINQSNGNFVSWRLLGTDPANVAFNLYRNGTRVNSSPLTDVTSYLDTGGNASSSYTVRPVVNGVEQGDSETSLNLSTNYISIPLQIPPGGTTPDGVSYTYSANDASVGDLDGDGQYEIVLKWDPSNSKDNSQSGYTGNVYIDAYKLNGTRMWRIDLGRNIRAGAHYTQFIVYDLDGDGKAEVAMKTADATVSGTGQVIGNASADYRNSSGYILTGPEYLTIFNGQTGAILTTVNYEPPRGNVADWGDSYGNRVDRFLAGVAYLDGQRPSLIMARGYYTRAVIVAWNWRNGQLTKVWTFDTNNGYSSYTGQGNHNLSIGDADGDGKDEIVYGAAGIDHDGRGQYSTGLGHGDAMHFGDLNPNRPGLEVWQCHETPNSTAGVEFRDAKTGALIWGKGTTTDTGRCTAGDLVASSRGAEMWASGNLGLYDVNGNVVGSMPSSINFVIWWDGDLLRELLDGITISKYGGGTLLSASGCSSNNGTKSTPSLTADILGDWREEVIFRTSDNTALRVYITTIPTNYRIYTLMHNTHYRVSIAWQNVAYNQPPHTGYYLGDGMTLPVPMPNIYVP